MTVSTIRKFTTDDQNRLQAAAKRFCERHGLAPAFDDPDQFEVAIERAIDGDGYGRNARMASLWTAVYCRALQVRRDSRVTVGYGYIGHHIP